jgi:hypothetical protein
MHDFSKPRQPSELSATQPATAVATAGEAASPSAAEAKLAQTTVVTAKPAQPLTQSKFVQSSGRTHLNSPEDIHSVFNFTLRFV